jgi:hypothetical protein
MEPPLVSTFCGHCGVQGKHDVGEHKQIGFHERNMKNGVLILKTQNLST